MEQPQPIHLNIFQRGILQKCATFFVYMVSAATGAWLIDWLDKQTFIRLAEEAQRQKLLSSEATRGFIILIEARDSTVIFPIMLVGLACGFVCWLFMRWAAKWNWSWPVILPKAVEFRSAMEQLGIADPADRIAFVRKHKLPVFIALSPLIGKEHEAVRAKLYAFAHHFALWGEDVFERHIGKQTLCLDADDFVRVLKEHGEHTKSAYSARIAELEQNLAALKSSGGTAPGRSQANDNLHASRAPFWLVAVPLIQRLRRDYVPDTEYSKAAIQAEFERELENYPAFKQAIRDLLATAQKIRENTPFALEGWGMRAICDTLREYGVKIKSTPGPESKK